MFCFWMAFGVTVIKRVPSSFLLCRISAYCVTTEYLHLCSVLRFPIPRLCYMCSYHRVSEFIVHMIHYNNYKSSKVRPKRSGIIINLLQRRVSLFLTKMKRSPFWSTLTSVITLPIWYAITVVDAGYKFTPKTIVLCHLWCIKYW